MFSRTSESLLKAGNSSIVRRSLALVGGFSALMLLLAGTQAGAKQAHFGYVGGRWSYARHVGWHRYWGGSSIGFYYAPTPVYVVPGYADSSYYTGPDFWTSNPSFGISLNFGGGGYYDGGYYPGRYYSGRDYHHGYYGSRPYGNYHGDAARYHVSPSYNGGHIYGGQTGHTYGGYSGGHTYGGRASTGSHSFGERGRR